MITLAELDLELKQRSDIVCADKELQQMRQSLLPPESAWWWYLEPATEDSKSKSWLDRFDWVWNVGTVVCLVVATSFITQTAKAFSNEGFDFLGTLSTIGQGAGLAFVAGGALTDKGKKAVESTLISMKVPASLHAEATFGASLLLLGAAYGIHHNLPKVGDIYFDRAQQHEKNGEWSQAVQSYKRALNFAQDDYKSQIAIGFLYEKLGNFEEALKVYKKGSFYGVPQFLNAQARVMLMAELQKNNWQGGIDEKVVREAEDLLARADKAITNLSRESNDFSLDPRLSADIAINRAIVIMAQLKYEKNIREETLHSFNAIVNTLISLDSLIEKESAGQQNPITVASTLGKSRAKCYYQQAFLIGRLSDSPKVNGTDPLINDQNILDDCWSTLSWGTSFYIPSDVTLFKNYKLPISNIDVHSVSEIRNISSFMGLVYSYRRSEAISKYGNRIVLIQDSETWLDLANQLTQVIQNKYDKGKQKYDQDIVWRFLLNKNGELIAYFAYDEKSRELANFQPFIRELLEKKTINALGSELAQGGKIEFVDFKVLISPEGKVKHILPWAMAYPSSDKYFEQICKQENCKNLILESRVNSVFKDYVADLNNPSEIGVLQSILQLSQNFLSARDDKGIYYKEPAIFKLKVSADGQIVNYEAINQEVIQRLWKKLPLRLLNGDDLKTPQFPEVEKAPYAYFKMEVRGVEIKFAPWSAPK
ncbi:tetratricopeptide repeat protein [Pseudanabaena sp. ABRG5-3]|uniref:tetratricopeptide repeat protein n=1 Tax=Pseudanabaena sp. ABRG5-3 TaxID=685565 RepID=UPI000F841EE8|nr:hypothetical protein [Pseudanabaena sp. ABRG5-3]